MAGKTIHKTPYAAISPSRPELSAAGKVVLITGGGQGLGPRIAHAFASAGSKNLAILGRTAASLQATKADIEAKHAGVKAITFIADIIDIESVHEAFEGTKKAFGPIDIFVSNASYFPTGEQIATANVDEWFKAFEVNVKATLILTQAFLANASKEPTYIALNTAAVHFRAMPFGVSAYAGSKLTLTKVLDYFTVENPHVRVVQVHPGSLETDMAKKAAEAGIVMPFDDIELPASFIVWAASPEAAFLQGKFVWANWDVEELKAKKDQLVRYNDLTFGLLGWP